MTVESAFHRGVLPLLEILLPGKEEAVMAIRPDPSLAERIEALAAKSTEGDLTSEERDEYEGYVRANNFVATMRREARALRADAAT